MCGVSIDCQSLIILFRQLLRWKILDSGTDRGYSHIYEEYRHEIARANWYLWEYFTESLLQDKHYH
jgi:hypothetical protein